MGEGVGLAELKDLVYFGGLLVSIVGNILWTSFRASQNRRDIDRLVEWRDEVEKRERAELKAELERARRERLNGRPGT